MLFLYQYGEGINNNNNNKCTTFPALLTSLPTAFKYTKIINPNFYEYTTCI